MKEKNVYKNITKLVIVTVLILLVTASANSATVKNDTPSGPEPLPFEEYYEWKDEFTGEQLIDASFSSNYSVSGGSVKIRDTYSVWTDPAWTRMKPVTVVNSGSALTDYAVNFIVDYDSDMKSDYGDIRFKHESTQNFLSYWIESKDSSEASIWVKVPSLSSGTNHMYMFYGNPAATDQSSFGDTFSIWLHQWGIDNQISYHADSEGAWDPDVSYGGGYFLVAWEEGQAYWPGAGSLGFKQEIRGSIFLPGDNEPVVFDKEVFSEKTQYIYYRNENPSIASSGSKWFVAWQHYAPSNTPPYNPSITTMDIKGRIVTRNGNQLSLGTTYDICSISGSCQADPKVIYDNKNNKFLVVWEDARDGTNDYDIWAQFINADTGALIGSNVRLNNDANSQCEPWAAFDPITEKYFVVWEDGVNPDNGPFRIRGGIFDESLNTQWTGTIAEPSGYPNQDIDYNFPCISFDSDSERFLITWNDGDISDNDWRGNVYGKLYDSAGNVEVSQFTIKDGNYVRTGIVPYLTSAFFVTYDNGQQIFGRLVSSAGELYSGDVQISCSAADGDWASIDTDGSNIFVGWEDLRIVYPYPYNDVYPDAFGNSIHINIPDGSDISITFLSEAQRFLEAVVTSVRIDPDNLEAWHQFLAVFDQSGGNVYFDIMDESGYNVLIPNVSPGQSLSGINPEVNPRIRCRARMSRENPSYTPKVESWAILYEGRDLEPPVTVVEDVEGTQGKNDWYVSETVTVWLTATDYPEATGSGINVTYYTLDGGATQIYNVDSGILLATTAPNWWDDWVINFWSVDNQGNSEDFTKPENSRTIKIDSKAPEITIIDPTEEQEVETPFWVKAHVVENAVIDRVEFDIEPFGEREGLPWVDTTPPWEWYCNEEPLARILGNSPMPIAGVSIQVRADVYDEAGNFGPRSRHQVFVNIKNWNAKTRTIVIPNFRSLLESLKLGLVVANNLDVKILGIQDVVDEVRFTATRVFTGKQFSIMDSNPLDGISASFDVPTGVYKLAATYYNEGKELGSELFSRVFFLNR